MPQPLTNFAWVAQLHKEAYSAVFNSALRIPGTKQAFAEQIGISRQYLSYILDPFDPRIPAPEVAEKMANALPLEPEDRAATFEHLLLARQSRVKQKWALRTDSTTPPLRARIAMLGQEHRLANTSTDPQTSHALLVAVSDTSRKLLLQIDMRLAPLSVTQICFILHDTLCLLNRPGQALFYAKLIRWLLGSFDASYRAQHHEYLDQLEFHAIRAATVAYHGLKLTREAYKSSQEAETVDAVRQRPRHTRPHLLRDKLNAYSQTTRFSLHVAEELAEEVNKLCQKHAGDNDPLWDFLMQRSLARAYDAYGNLAKARKVFETLLEQMYALPQMGPVPKTLFLNAFAVILEKQGQRDELQTILDQANSVITETSLTQEFLKLRQSYGPTMGPMISELGLIPTDTGATPPQIT